MVNGWYANLPNHEIPPRWMWPFEEELEQWFNEMKIARDQGSSPADADDADMTVNEYAEGLR